TDRTTLTDSLMSRSPLAGPAAAGQPDPAPRSSGSHFAAAAPAVPAPVDATGRTEADALRLEQRALERGRVQRVADRDLAIPVHHAPPRHIGVRPQRAQCLAHAARGARLAQHCRDTTVADNRAARDLADQPVNRLLERSHG